jgi:hypothetical protein
MYDSLFFDAAHDLIVILWAYFGIKVERHFSKDKQSTIFCRRKISLILE